MNSFEPDEVVKEEHPQQIAKVAHKNGMSTEISKKNILPEGTERAATVEGPATDQTKESMPNLLAPKEEKSYDQLETEEEEEVQPRRSARIALGILKQSRSAKASVDKLTLTL
jgi:hypothetical protein